MSAGSSPRAGGPGDGGDAGPPVLEGLLYRESTVVPGIAKKRYAVLYK
jgi:hypothetical protein